MVKIPIPKPKNDEKESEFIARCMGDDVMNKEYPDQKQRAAICYETWKITDVPSDKIPGGGQGQGGQGAVGQNKQLTDVKDGESKDAFISRCIADKKASSPNTSDEDIRKECEGTWDVAGGISRETPPGGSSGGAGGRSRDEKPSKLNSERILLHLCSTRLNYTTTDKPEKYNIDRSTILVGDGTYNGVYFPADEIEKAHLSWNRQPINLDHSDKVEDIVGYITEASYDKSTKKFSVKPVIDSQMPKSVFANGYIRSRLDAGSIPEVSVGVWVDRIDESLEDGKVRLTARNLAGDHLALVTRGACSPKDGCGVGLSNTQATVTLNEKGEYEDDGNKDKIKYYEMRIKQLKGGK